MSYMTLHRLGIRWADVQAWLLTAMLAVELSLLALGVISGGEPLLRDLSTEVGLAAALRVLGLV